MKKIILLAAVLFAIGLIACGSEKAKATTNKTDVTTSSKSKLIDDQTEPMTKKQLSKAKKVIKKAGDISELDGKKLYKMNCTTCHGLKGNLKINGAKDLSKSSISLENAVAQVYFGKGLMTSYNHLLSEKEIVAVAKYAETLRR